MGDRIDHGIDERRGRTHRGRLANAFGAYRMVRRRCDSLIGLEVGRLPTRWQEVIGEVRAEAVALLVEGDELHERDAKALGKAAMDLTLDEPRIDPYTTVVDSNHAPYFRLPRAAIDIDHHQIGAERIGKVGRVVICDALESSLHAIGQVRICREGDFLNRLRLRWRSLDKKLAVVEIDICLGGFK